MAVLEEKLLMYLNLSMVPGVGFERTTARSSAECSPGLSYPGTSNDLIAEQLKCVFYCFQKTSVIPFLLLIILAKTNSKSDNLFRYFLHSAFTFSFSDSKITMVSALRVTVLAKCKKYLNRLSDL